MTISPGHTIWLRGGTYPGNYLAALVGSEPDYITVRAYPGETPVIDGSLNIQGGWLTFRNIAFLNSRTDRVRAAGGELDTVTGTTGAANIRLINCIIHDSAQNGIGLWQQATNCLIYGCVIYNNGFVNTADDQGDGHGIYTQNTAGVKTFKHNILGPPFNFCFQAYARTDTPQRGWDFIENVVIGGKLYFGGDNSVRQEDVLIDANHIYAGNVQLGDLYLQNGDVILTNNRLYGGQAGVISGQPLTIKYWENITLTGNKIVSLHHNVLRFIEPADTGSNVRNWDNNAYYGNGLDAAPFNEDGVQDYTLTEWRTVKGFDGNSTLTATLPTTNEIFVYPNEYRDIHSCRMGIIVVWNWEGLSSVGVDLSSLELANGNYCLRNGVNISETYSFAYAGSALSIPMDGWTVSSPIGMDAPLIDNPFPLFGCFVLERAL